MYKFSFIAVITVVAFAFQSGDNDCSAELEGVFALQMADDLDTEWFNLAEDGDAVALKTADDGDVVALKTADDGDVVALKTADDGDVVAIKIAEVPPAGGYLV